MPRRTKASVAYLGINALLWAVALPAVLVADAAGESLPWRGPLQIGAAAVILGAGLWLIDSGARTLAAARIGLWTARPGTRVVTDGVYGRVRNPIEMGTAAVAISSVVALDLELGWVIPAAALVWAIGGVGPYEDRLLFEEFGEEFSKYRKAVRKWIPRRRTTSSS
jgi:protein-S-isoprenylcysteine O-methyltransferase Ste14